MKLIIEIPEYAYKHIREYYEKNDTVESTYSYIYHGTPIPDNATNDDVLKALFDERGYMGIHDRMMHTKWLFAPYQKGGKE